MKQAKNQLILLNNFDEDSAPNDDDDGNMILEPHELGLQTWENGQLKTLNMGYKQIGIYWFGDFGYVIDTIPENFYELNELERFVSHDNQLMGIPNPVYLTTSLKSLEISNNYVDSISSQIQNLNQIKYLNFSYNNITELPLEIGQLNNLQMLGLSNNLLTYIPDTVASIDSLFYLTIHHNILYCRNGNIDIGQIPLFLWDGTIPNVRGLYEQDCQTVSTVSGEVTPDNFMVNNPYPNPFNSNIYIPINVNESLIVSIKVYDINGKYIKTILNGRLNEGKYSLKLKADFPTGLYFLAITDNIKTKVYKISLIK